MLDISWGLNFAFSSRLRKGKSRGKKVTLRGEICLLLYWSEGWHNVLPRRLVKSGKFEIMTFDDVLCSVSGGLLASRPIEEQESQLLGKGENKFCWGRNKRRPA